MIKVLLKSKILLSLWLTSIVILSSLFFFIPNITEKHINELVVTNSQNSVKQIKLTRSYYLENVVKKIENNNNTFNFDINHQDLNNTLPLPATLIYDLGNIFSKNTGNQFRTYSEYPFKHRQNRVLSQKDKLILQNIEKSNGIYVLKDFINNKPVLRVAIADYMTDKSCISCHNNHPAKIWDNDKWEMGDIRGVIEIITPLEDSLLHIQNMRNQIIFFIASVFLILILYYSYTLVKRENELLTKNDVLDEKIKAEIDKNNEKEQLLIQKSKLASQGEMLNNIAHQWRQPISELSAILMNIDIQYNSGKLDKKFVDEKISKSELILEYLSNTIDDFKSFLKPDKQKVVFNFQELIAQTLQISQNSFQNNITIIKDIDSTLQYYGYRSELAQVFLNIISNSETAFKQKKTQNAFIKITINTDSHGVNIIFEDNAGGIEKENIDNVFELYYTTTQEGSGIGLYMSKIIIEKHFDGKIICQNTTEGVTFKITFPLIN